MHQKRPQKIWVLYGGNSSEREVSLKSAKGVIEALKAKGFDTTGYDVQPGLNLISKINFTQAPDLVFIGLHGTFGEDGTIQGFLESLQIPFVGSGVASSALCFDKSLSKRKLKSLGLPCPFSYDVQGEEGFRRLLSSEHFPTDFFQKDWFIKPSREGSTVGIERYRGSEIRDGKDSFFEKLFKTLEYDSLVLIEEWVEGPELTIPLLHGKGMPIVEIRPASKFYDYESKYTKGKTVYLCPAPMDAELTKQLYTMAEESFKALECQDYGRLDVILSKDGPRILEMNTLPGMTETSLVPKSALAHGMDYGTFLENLGLGSYNRQLRK